MAETAAHPYHPAPITASLHPLGPGPHRVHQAPLHGPSAPRAACSSVSRAELVRDLLEVTGPQRGPNLLLSDSKCSTHLVKNLFLFQHLSCL